MTTEPADVCTDTLVSHQRKLCIPVVDHAAVITDEYSTDTLGKVIGVQVSGCIQKVFCCMGMWVDEAGCYDEPGCIDDHGSLGIRGRIH